MTSSSWRSAIRMPPARAIRRSAALGAALSNNGATAETMRRRSGTAEPIAPPWRGRRAPRWRWNRRTRTRLSRSSRRRRAGIASTTGSWFPRAFSPEAQIDQLAALVGERQIDILLVQEGGNSIGFTRVVRALVEADPLFDPVCYHLMVDQAFESVRDGNWGRGTSLHFTLPFDWSCDPAVGWVGGATSRP